ncbi:MAG: ribonuclease P protein component [Candidatus Staskawiczbacteria bacterium CG10_big_fil_rev_8_21_14_0_10_38_10]|uniref:Ribonuclease P protein component n=1 Tax=Candidatus Staskawiczbacteria bacterium CG10_big_fil_rev_8_21_14_0_10_38_10 TaxID=1974891 RepID=A0A2H9T158_9BACT|nr:MAG: ribonuclease P protein component [Candidatus Staskawiczbacteria bacterium CG10_big_fil_rev_8_21_14_0_10_38_10]
MLPKINRLKRKKEFKTIFKKGKWCKEGLLVLKLIPNDLGKSRFAFIVSQKVSKKATVRNRIKRQLREIVREIIPNIQKGFDGILIVKPGLESRNFQEVKALAKKLFKTAKII